MIGHTQIYLFHSFKDENTEATNDEGYVDDITNIKQTIKRLQRRSFIQDLLFED